MNEWVKKEIKEIKERIISKPYFYGFIIVIILIFLPILIFSAYSIGDHGYVIIQTRLTVGDALVFYGTVLTFLGTITLSALALWQNYKLSKANQNLTTLQLEEHTPYLIIEVGEETNHIELNRNPDTTQSVLSGSKGFVSFNSSEDQELYQAESNRLMKLCQITSEQDLTQEKVLIAEKAQMELSQLSKKLRKTIIEKYTDTFWILKKDSKQLCDFYSNAHEQKSLRVIFKNTSKATIKRIIIEKINLECCDQEWSFIPHSQRNYISQLLFKDQTFIFYINLFWEKADADLNKILRLFDIYKIRFEFTLITPGNNKYRETISSDWAFGKLAENYFELV